MKWRGGRRSDNIEDLREAGERMTGRGGGAGLRVGKAAGGGGIGVVVIAVVLMLLGVDPSVVLDGGDAAPEPQTRSRSKTAGVGGAAGKTDARQDELKEFVSVVLADTEDVWHPLFEDAGLTYEEPTLVLFSNAVRSACGYAEAAMGPFYCSRDQKVYIDLAFFNELARRFKAPGDFAQAYVVAHEVGHHVQNLLGILRESHAREARLGDGTREANAISVQVELQADCFAGVWAHHAERSRAVLEPGDLEEALRAATAVGDDTIQKRTQGAVVPDSFTHGSAAQRVRWFRTGFESGEMESCNSYKSKRK